LTLPEIRTARQLVDAARSKLIWSLD